MKKEMTLIDEIYDRMKDDTEIIHHNVSTEESKVTKFYAGKTLFITGTSGFLGKGLMEKLLRSCPDIRHIYILMRGKKNDSYKERAEKYFQHEIFDLLRKSNPNFEKKVTAFNGDLSLDNIGMSNEDQRIIKKETNIIIHNAANVKFNARINVLLTTNVLGTKNLLDLAEQCENLELFMYVSTAYSHCYKLRIEEKFYTAPADLTTIHNLIEADLKTENGMSEEAEKSFLGDFLNRYTYSKAAAEELVRLRAEKVAFPCGIFRPSIVLSTYKEPQHLLGWLDNANGPVLVILAYGCGIMRAAYHKRNAMDMIPSDMTVNALIITIKDLPKRCAIEKQAVVYNYGTSVVNPISLLDFAVTRHEMWELSPRDTSSNTVWIPDGNITDSYATFIISHCTIHLIAACFADLALILMRKKPKVLSIFIRVTKNLSSIFALITSDWRVHMPQTLKVIEQLNPTDQELFFSDLRKIDWKDFSYTGWSGYRHYILKENLNSGAGERRHFLLKRANFVFKIVLLLIFIYFYAKMVNSLFNQIQIF